uniref:5-nitroanthranilic acid aminohydrolase n=1 Tax=Bradyrhizobium sp. TaxID=376 RepID=UPI000859AD8A|nr:Chain A, 5-nitroanthranilic acid aminohydrolase [Bradyrhizobium sp.]5K8P_B Chain B, 5-nitroanthranilic acid aminohydrolase [Bradyrhizobium sp.]5K8P_C Chain C, 5-nitroanthranilic acid aminohydrolase [Bradyrhizobium sp.]5K8P_D Chain D, 5-nitroanthranilic acid aminohydrolase [Bradyrhizobium sp.]5K8P_E Chain E, 5-nitroanthranilic acid aminohydrolase [Bradyrhizobium sp.]5K8P_F Chain F, 5-nitroanthranilic acid aminohydrolase [Bradyrhizobium sp.]5K8P_G Chain G, 5-nitroanthranilic acid aminohydrol
MAGSNDVAKVMKTLDGMREGLIQTAVELGSIEAPTGREGAAGDYVYEWMARNGFGPERVGVFDDRFNVVGRLRGTGGGASLSFNSHLDTIMAREDTARFADANDRIYHEAWHEEGRIYGYSVVNCKGPMACWLIAAKALKEAGAALKGDVVLTAVCGEIDCEPVDEFQGHDYLAEDIGARYAISHGAISDYALVAEATNFKPAWVEAGKVFLKVTVFAGPSRYTPYVPRPVAALDSPNAIVRMAKLVEALEEWADNYEKRYTREYGGGTVVPKVAIGAIRGGVPYKIYAFPELCSIYMDIRLNPDTNPLVVQREVEAVVSKLGLKAEVKPFLFRRGYEAQGIEPLQNALEVAHREVVGRPTERPGSPECSMWRDTNPYNELGIPSLTYGCGGGAGGGNTYFLVDDMLKAAKVYAMTAMDLCNRTP